MGSRRSTAAILHSMLEHQALLVRPTARRSVR